ncbi:MAG: FixH family protein [Woeseia sp.]
MAHRFWTGVVILLVFTTTPAEELVSRNGLFHVSYESRLDPIVINRIHSWVVHLETADDEPIRNAKITVSGGMPAHDHGLPTRPRMTRQLGNGDYLIEGMRFHMNGFWQIEITISADGGTDTVIVELEL